MKGITIQAANLGHIKDFIKNIIVSDELDAKGNSTKRLIAFVYFEPPNSLLAKRWYVCRLSPDDYDYRVIGSYYTLSAARRKLRRCVVF